MVWLNEEFHPFLVKAVRSRAAEGRWTEKIVKK